MSIPRAVALTQVDAEDYAGPAAEALLVVGDVPGGGGEAGPVAWGDVTGKPATFPPTIGTSGTTAAAGNHTQAATTVTVAAGEGIEGANVQEVLADLAARVVALEAAE